MLFVGDVYIYVSDFTLALRFWADGLQLEVAEKEVSEHSQYARLNFTDGGSSLRIIGPVDPWPEATRPMYASVPSVTFDITTDDFDATLVRLMENGGKQIDNIETYEGLRAVTIADPDGNAFELLELGEEAAEENNGNE